MSDSQIQVLPVVMAGGSGTRLWPLSRAQHPKQFLVLQGNQSLFQQAHLRLQALEAPDIHVGKPCVVGNEEHRFLVLDQLRELKGEPSSLLLEPIGRNTHKQLATNTIHFSPAHPSRMILPIAACQPPS